MFHSQGWPLSHLPVFSSLWFHLRIMQIHLATQAYELSCCYSAGANHRKYIHSCLTWTLLSYQKWLNSFPDINTLLKVLYCKFFVFPDSALSGLPTASNNNGLSVRGNCGLEMHIKIPDAQYIWKMGPDSSRTVHFYSLGCLIFFMILNMGLPPPLKTSTTSCKFIVTQWELGPHWCQSGISAVRANN